MGNRYYTTYGYLATVDGTTIEFATEEEYNDYISKGD